MPPTASEGYWLKLIYELLSGTGGASTPKFNVDPATALVGGQNTTNAGTRKRLAGTLALKAGVHVKALHANTGYVYLGTNTVDATHGYVLDAGESVFIEIDDLSKVWFDVSVNTEGVSFLAM